MQKPPIKGRIGGRGKGRTTIFLEGRTREAEKGKIEKTNNGRKENSMTVMEGGEGPKRKWGPSTIRPRRKKRGQGVAG